MPGPYLERIYGVLVKVESTSGVDATPVAATDAIRIQGAPPILAYDFMEPGDRDDVQTGVLSGADRAAPAGLFGKVDLSIELRGAAAVYSSSVKPPGDALWRASGLGVATSFTGGAELYSYKTLDTGAETVTVYLYSENKLFKMVGCVAQPKLSAEVYKRGIATFTLTGKITSVAELAMPALTLNAIIPPLDHSATAALGSWNTGSTEPLMLISAAMDLGNIVADLSSAGATDGLVAYLITDRKVTQDFTYNVPALATFNPFTQAALDGSNALLTSWQLGTIQYNKIKIEARWSPRAPRRASRNGIATYQQSGVCKVGGGLTGGREMQITYN